MRRLYAAVCMTHYTAICTFRRKKYDTNSKFKIEVQIMQLIFVVKTMKNTAEVCLSGRRRKAS